MPAPRFYLPHDPELHRAFESIALYIDSVRVPKFANGRGIRVYQDEDSVHIECTVNPSIGGITAATTILPWTIFSTPVANTPGSYNLTVWPGQANGIISSNLFGVGFILNPFLISGISSTTVHYANLNVTTSNNQVTSHTISFDTVIAPPIPVNAATPISTFSFCFGMIIGSSTIYRLIGEGNMYFTPSVIYRNPVTTPAPNAIPWTDMYTWIPSIV